MVDVRRYFYKLQAILGKTGSADMINSRWSEVLACLDRISIEYANELQKETRYVYEKPSGSGILYDLERFPPNRLMAMNIILSYWIGWHSIPKKLNDVSDAQRIEEAYIVGHNDFILGEAAKRGC
jgi:hypothetical protein